MAQLGMDVDTMNPFPMKFQVLITNFMEQWKQLYGQFEPITWVGDDANKFRPAIKSAIDGQLLKVQETMDQFAQDLNKHITEQRTASGH